MRQRPSPKRRRRALIAPDPKHSTATEERRWLIGESDIGVVVVAFTIRQPDNIYRLITARRASRKERSRYEEAKRVPL
ncbi:MAG: BrnT family toxin [Deltaproteobacteria bacterium]|nr:BrnT family toxin [Deltaproteobacteria bacterium]